MTESVECSACKGTGRVILSGVYADTLRVLRKRSKQGKHVVANRDASLFCCRGTTLSNRLAWLESHGFAQSKRHGRENRYIAT